MKKSILICAVACTCMVSTEAVYAQGFLNKVKKAADKVSSVTSSSSNNSEIPNINWSEIPIYTTQEVVMVDENGNPVLNEDGTEDIRVFLVDQNGNRRSAEAVAAQNAALLGAAIKLIAKVGTGAISGAISGGGVGAAVGAATGTLASIDDIKTIKDQKKSLDAQKKLIKAYQQNFTAEGKPVDASADLSKIKDLNLNKENSSTLTEEELVTLVSSPSFNDTSVEGMSLEEIDF